MVRVTVLSCDERDAVDRRVLGGRLRIRVAPGTPSWVLGAVGVGTVLGEVLLAMRWILRTEQLALRVALLPCDKRQTMFRGWTNGKGEGGAGEQSHQAQAQDRGETGEHDEV
jgi:hypothetical protein